MTRRIALLITSGIFSLISSRFPVEISAEISSEISSLLISPEIPSGIFRYTSRNSLRDSYGDFMYFSRDSFRDWSWISTGIAPWIVSETPGLIRWFLVRLFHGFLSLKLISRFLQKFLDSSFPGFSSEIFLRSLRIIQKIRLKSSKILSGSLYPK